MKIIKLLCIFTLYSVFNVHGMLKSNLSLQIRKTGMLNLKKTLSEEEKFFYRNQNLLAMSNCKVNEEKEKFYQEQTQYTQLKKYCFGVLVATLLMEEVSEFFLPNKDVNGFSIPSPITSLLSLPQWLYCNIVYKTNELAIAHHMKNLAIEEYKEQNTKKK